MKTLTAMIRKQKITIDLQKQELHALRQRHAECERELQHWRQLCSETEQYLWLQVTAGHEISLDRLNLARMNHNEQQNRCAQTEVLLKQMVDEVLALEKTIAYGEKALEKFAELFAERKREARNAAQNKEWEALDEWAVNTLGQRA
jgi:hypothetical protein